MVDDSETDRPIVTDVRPIEPEDFARLGPGWRFDWRDAVESAEVFKLIDHNAPDLILGLMGLKRHDHYVEVTLLESHPRSIGKAKKFRGVPGRLFAFAARLSFAIGGAGFIVIDAKTELIDHFERVYGFERIGRSQRMILTTAGAVRLIARYEGSAPDA